jgi:hypothetical protein
MDSDPVRPDAGGAGEGMVTMTDTSTVDHGQWASLLDRLTKDHEGDYVTIEVLDPTYGDNTEAERLPFQYAAYDRKDDVAFVVVGGKTPQYPVALRHMVPHPTDVSTTADPPAVRVVDPEGTTTVVSFFPATR